MPIPDHVVVVVEENHDFNGIIGNADASFINSLASTSLVYTNYQDITHPSQPNYLALYSGSTQGVTDDGDYFFDAPSLGSQVDFRGYHEADSPQKHNPWQSFADTAGLDRLFPDQFHYEDYNNLPQVSFVSPSLQNDMHDGTVAQGDAWLQANFGDYINWAQNNNSLFILTFDEGENNERVLTLVTGQGVTPGTDGNSYDHYSLLKTIEDTYGVPELGHAQESANMDFYQGGSAPAIQDPNVPNPDVPPPDSNASTSGGMNGEPDQFVFNVSQDAYPSGTQFILTIDDQPMTGVLLTQSTHGEGSDQVVVNGSFPGDSHNIGITSLNAPDGTPENVYLDAVTHNGQDIGASLAAPPQESAFLFLNHEWQLA